MKSSRLKGVVAIVFLLMLWSCEERQDLRGQIAQQPPEVQAAMERLTRGGTTLPGGHQLTAELSNPGSAITPHCPGCEAAEAERGRRAGEFRTPDGTYTIRSQSERRELVRQIIAAGPERLGTTRMRIGGVMYEVMNDHVTLPDGTYVPLTFPEAQEIARAWRYEIPSGDQLRAIATHAANEGNQFRAITRTPNNGEATQLGSMNAMMNDPAMRERSRAGRERLIDGHFKWYTNDGRIYGFARGDGRFWQNSPSAAHVGDPGYYDYSHGVRLIRRVE